MPFSFQKHSRSRFKDFQSCEGLATLSKGGEVAALLEIQSQTEGSAVLSLRISRMASTAGLKDAYRRVNP